MTSDKKLSIYFFGYLRASRRHLKFARHSSNFVFEVFVLNNLIASPFIKPLFTPREWHEVRQAERTPNVVFVVASHYQSLQIVVLLLQACLLSILALSRKLLLQQLQWLQQDRRFFYTRVSSTVV